MLCSLVEFEKENEKENNNSGDYISGSFAVFIKCKNYADVAHGEGENNVVFDIN